MKRSLPSLLWLGSVVLLALVAVAGSLNPDTLRRYAPAATVLYVSSTTEHGRVARAYLPDGTVVALLDAGDTVQIDTAHGETTAAFRDPFPEPTPFENLLVRFHGSYGIMKTNLRRPSLLFPAEKNTTVLSLHGATSVSLHGVDKTRLPGSVFLWSTLGEPVSALRAEERSENAVAEGRFGNPASPDLAALIITDSADDLLRTYSARRQPSRRRLQMPDGTVALELVVDPEAVELESVATAFGPGRSVIGDDDHRGAAIDVGTYNGQRVALLVSSNRALEETQALSLPNCPITSVTTYVRAPFFVIGLDDRGRETTCVQNFAE